VLTLVIDIKPGRSQSGVNTASLWTLPVAILATTLAQRQAFDFDATTADLYTVPFGATGAGPCQSTRGSYMSKVTATSICTCAFLSRRQAFGAGIRLPSSPA